MQIKLSSIDEYIGNAPAEVQELLKNIRATIHKAAPEAEEAISYGMPAFSIGGKPLVYFAAFKNHIGFYATPSGHTAFEKELSKYKQGKGSVQFPLDKPMPLSLITKIVKFRLKEVKEKLKAKKK
ncbi:MAG: DUF1801 domain-containing protein [Chitinophagaceae bacterium]|nr:DUF1801 domain-containing protein [Chitinophagaceae bacterium]